MSTSPRPKLAYLYSRYPVISHTFCDNEMLALEAAGWDLTVCGIYPPKNDLRHPRLNAMQARVVYNPATDLLKELEALARANGQWPEELVARHRKEFGKELRPEERCRNILYLADRLTRLGIDHVHMHFANQATHSALFLKALTGITFSFTPQAADFLADLESEELLNEMCREAEFVVAPCDYARAELAKLCPGSEAKLVTIYNGIDPQGYPAAAPRSETGKLRIVSVGRLVEFKGFHDLIAAIATARDQNAMVELELMGNGPWRERLEAQVSELGLEDQVRFHGTVTIDQMKQCFSEVDAFALACKADERGASDMLPTVITEAMLCGLPVVSCRVAGVPEQVADGTTGILTDPGDRDAIAAALVRLANKRGLADAMGDAGRKRAHEVLALSATLPRLEDLFGRVSCKDRDSEQVRIAALYATGNPDSRALLEVEKPVIDEAGGRCWLIGGQLPGSDAADVAALSDGAVWVPDAMALEMEWRSREDERNTLEAIRTELSTSVCGEYFLEAARRALWLAVDLRKCGGIELLYAPGAEEALVAWLVWKLTGIPFCVAMEREGEFDGKLRKSIMDDARNVALSSSDNPLKRPHSLTLQRTWKDFTWQGQMASWTRAKRQTALQKWLQR